MDQVRRFAPVLGVVLWMSAGPPVFVQGDQSVATFRSSVDLVPINAVVHDRHGRVVTTLTRGDFEVFDKGERRRILDFQNDQHSPITIALLVDESGSMTMGPRMTSARQTLARLVAELQDGRDVAALFTFDSDLHERQPFTVHPTSVRAALNDAQPFGTTSLYDAIAATAHRFEGRPAVRRAIVVFTDGVDTSSRLTAAEVSGLASSIDVPVYVVVTVGSFDRTQQIERAPTDPTRLTADLKDLADWTGGSLLWVSEAGSDPAREIVAELRQQYLIAIESSPHAEWRPIDVRVRDPHLTVRARGGYFSRDLSVTR